MLLKHLTIEGYKSIKALERFELRQRNVMIGANGAGKSNLIGCFKLLNSMTYQDRDLQHYVEVQGGANSVLHDSVRVTPQIRIHLDFEEEHQGIPRYNEYKCRLVHVSPDRLIFGDEAIRYRKNRFDNGATWDSMGSTHRESLLHRERDDGNKTAGAILWLLNQCKVYQFHDTSDKSAIRLKRSVYEAKYLRSDGRNLASFLYGLQQNEPRHYRRIVDTIKQVTPFFEDFVLEPIYDSLILQWRERNSDMIFSANQASDGTLRTMALVSLLLQPRDRLPELLIIDEPELGLHPRAIDILQGLIHRVSQTNQVIIATQSPTLINYFDPEDIVVVERVERESTFKRLSSQELAGWLDEYSLAELWERNITGGNPR